MVLLGALHVLFVPRGQPLAFLGVAGVGLRTTVGVQAVGVGERLHERVVEPLELGLGKLDQPGAQQATEGQPGDGQAGNATPAGSSSTMAMPTQTSSGHDEDPGFAAPFIVFGMIRPSRILMAGSIRPRRLNSSSTGSGNFEYDSRAGAGRSGTSLNLPYSAARVASRSRKPSETSSGVDQGLQRLGVLGSRLAIAGVELARGVVAGAIVLGLGRLTESVELAGDPPAGRGEVGLGLRLSDHRVVDDHAPPLLVVGPGLAVE